MQLGATKTEAMTLAAQQPSLFESVPFAFAERFLADHAGQIILEPRTAVLELIANAYDAGAKQIKIQWPSEKGMEFSVIDNGIGMTREEFVERWQTPCYDRTKKQGTAVKFPPGGQGIEADGLREKRERPLRSVLG
jgi:hypothetical protein